MVRESKKAGDADSNHNALVAERAVRDNPTDEAAHGTLIHAYLNAGRWEEALHACLELNAMLEAHRRIPTPATRQIMERAATSPEPTTPRRTGQRGLLVVAACGIVTLVVFLPLRVHQQKPPIPAAPLTAGPLIHQANEAYQSGQYDVAEKAKQSNSNP